MKYITCSRCNNYKPLSCFTSTPRKCDQCVSAIVEYKKKRHEVIEKEKSHRKTPIFKNFDTSIYSKRARKVIDKKEAILEKMALQKELANY